MYSNFPNKKIRESNRIVFRKKSRRKKVSIFRLIIESILMASLALLFFYLLTILHQKYSITKLISALSMNFLEVISVFKDSISYIIIIFLSLILIILSFTFIIAATLRILKIITKISYLISLSRN